MGDPWWPLVWAAIAKEASDTYTNVRDGWSQDEIEAWTTYLEKKQQREDAVKQRAKRSRR